MDSRNNQPSSGKAEKTVKSEKEAIDELSIFCKRKGFVFPSSEIYGGFSGFYDYGPYGVELKNNLKQHWWKTFVQSREDVVGIDGTIIAHPKIWEASGHVQQFTDLMLTCSKCRKKQRADTFIEDSLKISADGMKAPEINETVQKHNLTCPACKAPFTEVNDFNLMFKTNVGPSIGEDSKAYLRPETAQLIFANFRNVVDTCRVKLPFGIAQSGKSFRNEISPRNFLFRMREFEQMELEYFVHPEKREQCPFVDEVLDTRIIVFSSPMQENLKSAETMTLKDALHKKIIKNPWHAYWLGSCFSWFTNLGADPAHFRIRQHLPTEKSHYSTDTWDLEYNFPFGFKELLGIADRGDFDLQQHIKHSGKDLSLFDQETNKKVVPHVIAEPSFGVDRAFMVFLFDAFHDDKERGNIVLHLSPKLAPVKIGIFPLVNKLDKEAYALYQQLKDSFAATFDRSGSVGRRYARADELGIPYCITFDFDSLEDKSVTVRDRDTTRQIRIKILELEAILSDLLKGKTSFDEYKHLLIQEKHNE